VYSAFNRCALEALADSFETMAFMSPAKAELPFNPPADAMLASVHFAGGVCGTLELVAPRALGGLAARNMFADAAAEVSTVACDDALRELMNVLGGLTLRRWSTALGTGITMSMPTLSPFDVTAAWPGFVASPGAVVLDVETNILALRVREGAGESDVQQCR
jgi:hypothetical protein